VRVEDGGFIFDLLNRWNIHHATFRAVSDAMLAVCQWSAARDAFGGGGAARTFALDSFRTFLERVFRTPPEKVSSLVRYYKVVIHSPPDDAVDARSGAPLRRGKTLSYWCFSPGAVMSELADLGVRSIVLASGTLSPLDSYAAELAVPFAVRLENAHVIAPDQVFAAVLARGATGRALNSSFEHRDSPEYLAELGLTIANISRIVPDGLLVFFPSYSMMNKATEFWQHDAGGRIWASLGAQKTLVLEPRAAHENVLQSVVEHVPHGQHPGDIGGRDDDRIGLLARLGRAGRRCARPIAGPCGSPATRPSSVPQCRRLGRSAAARA
jgi:regulator of telomere elongation helicase 1